MKVTGITHKPFIPLFEDAVWCAFRALERQDLPNPTGIQTIRHEMSRFGHLSILSSALALEAAANCALAKLGKRGKTTKDIDKLSVLGKFDVYLLSRGGGDILDRGHKFVQPMDELINVRNAIVHPKIVNKTAAQLNGLTFERETPKSKLLKIPSDRMLLRWTGDMAKEVLLRLCDFLNYFFLGLCKHSFEEVPGVLVDQAMFDGVLRQSSYQPTDFIWTAMNEWKLDTRFLHIIKCRTTIRDGKEIIEYPTYP